MKNEKVTTKTKEKKSNAGKSTTVNSGKKSSAGAVPDTIAAAGASEKTKAGARRGHGLANEGTVVSYEEQQ